MAMFGWHLLTAILSSPRSSSIGLSTTSTHYTSCLLNSRQWSQLPSFVTMPRQLTATDGTLYFVLIFENARFAQGSESCFGVLSHSPLPSLGVDSIQEVRCFTDIPGIPGYDVKQIDTEYSQLGVSQTVTSVTERIDDQKLFQQSTGNVYDQLNGRSFDAINKIYKSNVFLDSFHTHNTLGAPYGYIGRVYATEPTTVTKTTSRVSLNVSLYNALFDANISDTDLHTCNSFQHINGERVSLVVTSLYNEAATQQDFLSRIGDNPTQVTTALGLAGADAHPRGLNLEETIWESYSFFVDPPAVVGFSSFPLFRTVTAILDLTYPFFVGIQRKVNGVFPSNRFNGMRRSIWVHMMSGSIILYTGVALHLDELIGGVVEGDSEGATSGLSWTKLARSEDESTGWHRTVYYIMGIATVVHSLTIASVVTKVMGEKRITVPLYFCAGLVNLYNAIKLLQTPRLHHAYLVWGSVNTFIYVRFQILLLCLSYIDWELIYTYACSCAHCCPHPYRTHSYSSTLFRRLLRSYSILAAAAVTYPLSGQSEWVFLMVAAPTVYGPFHERFCRLLRMHMEDDIGGNSPSAKHISQLQSDMQLIKEMSRDSINRRISLNVSRDSINKRISLNALSPRATSKESAGKSNAMSVVDEDMSVRSSRAQYSTMSWMAVMGQHAANGVSQSFQAGMAGFQAVETSDGQQQHFGGSSAAPSVKDRREIWNNFTHSKPLPVSPFSAKVWSVNGIFTASAKLLNDKTPQHSNRASQHSRRDSRHSCEAPKDQAPRQDSDATKVGCV